MWNMAQVTEVRLVDDIDGGKAAETVAFGLDGKTYEIDLSEKRSAELREILAPFAGAARRAGGSSARGQRAAAPSIRPSASREDTAAIREWAAANGFEVSSRGRIASDVRAAFASRGSDKVAALAVEEPVVEAEVKAKRRSRKKVADPFTAEH